MYDFFNQSCPYTPQLYTTTNKHTVKKIGRLKALCKMHTKQTLNEIKERIALKDRT